ncbi:hypothetical protein EDB85DRAFT_1892935 [Lactarius pseudohatsudake]|nr:hypothetical protein EDB85DRAFT_1892935 [Lactarius pseudohatsudake]
MCRPCAQSGVWGHWARLPICAPPGHAPPGPRTPSGASAWCFALAREPRGWGNVAARSRLPLRANPWERGGFCRRPFAFALAREPGKGGGALGPSVPPVRLPLYWMHRGGGAASARCPRVPTREEGGAAPGWSAPPMHANGGGALRVWGAHPLSSPPAPLVCVSPHANQGKGGHRAASGVARGVPGKRGEGAVRACSPMPSCIACPVHVEGGGGGDTCRTPIARVNGGCTPSCTSPVRESTGAEVGAVFGSPVRCEGAGAYLSRASFARKWGQGGKGGACHLCAPLVPRGPALVCRVVYRVGKGGSGAAVR